MGVIQLINRKTGSSFIPIDERSVMELAKILGIALYNQKRIAKKKAGKFDYLLENHHLSPRELEKATRDARNRKLPIEFVLLQELKISKKVVGQ